MTSWKFHDFAQSQDQHLVNEVYTHDTYLLKHIALPESPVILDVGASIGVFSRLVQDRYPAARVFAIESNPKHWDYIRANAPQAVLVPAALHYGTDLAILDTVYPGTPTTGGSIVLPRSEVESSTDPRYLKMLDRVETVTIERLITAHKLDRIDLIKLDCEGSEYSILANLSRSAAVLIRDWVGEYHGGRQRFHDAVGALSGRLAITYNFWMWGGWDHMGMFRMITHEIHPHPEDRDRP